MDLDVIHREHVEMKRLFDKYLPMLEEVFPEWQKRNAERQEMERQAELEQERAGAEATGPEGQVTRATLGEGERGSGTTSSQEEHPAPKPGDVGQPASLERPPAATPGAGSTAATSAPQPTAPGQQTGQQKPADQQAPRQGQPTRQGQPVGQSTVAEQSKPDQAANRERGTTQREKV